MKRLRTPRLMMAGLLSMALVAGVAVSAPQQVGVLLYKACLVCLAGWGGYWLDRAIFPYARPDGYLVATDWLSDTFPKPGRADHQIALGYEQVFAAAMLRRALLVGLCMLAVGLGL